MSFLQRHIDYKSWSIAVYRSAGHGGYAATAYPCSVSDELTNEVYGRRRSTKLHSGPGAKASAVEAAKTIIDELTKAKASEQ